jgi:hypothetical protein
MAVFLSPVGGVAAQFFTNTGAVLTGGKLYTYAAGTTTPRTTYTTSAGSTARTNPIILDSAGRVPDGGEIWLTDGSQYKFVLKDSTDVLIATYDNVTGIGDTSSLLAFEATLAGSAGSSLVGYQPAGGSSVATTVQAKLRQYVSVLDFGADSTGATSSLTAFQNAVNSSRNVYVPAGTYKLDSQLVISNDGTSIVLGASVTLNISGTVAQQAAPFGNCINFLANNCSLIGSGQTSVIQIVGNCYANGIGILHKSGFLVRDVTLDGNKSGVTATTDDTFGSAISIICATASGATNDVNATIDNCIIKNWTQYGFNLYGNKANGIKIVNCNISAIGNSSDTLSVGSGIAASPTGSNLIIANNVIINSKYYGIFISSAGTGATNLIIENNVLNQNAGGIVFIEAAQYNSVNNIGLNGITVTGNTCTNNSTNSGIAFSVTSVGFLSNITCTGNVCTNSNVIGIYFASTTPTSGSYISQVTCTGNTTSGNTVAGISFSSNILTSVYSNSGNMNNGVPYYQPGTFTPLLYGSTTAGTGTYTTQTGNFTKIGDIINYEIVIIITAHTGTGNAYISGLPYAISSSEPQCLTWAWSQGLSITGQLYFTPNSGISSTSGILSVNNNSSNSSLPMFTTGSLRITGYYRTDNA